MQYSVGPGQLPRFLYVGPAYEVERLIYKRTLLMKLKNAKIIWMSTYWTESSFSRIVWLMFIPINIESVCL